MAFIRREDMTVRVIWKGTEIKVEKKCTTCAFGSLDEETQPCLNCFMNYTPENPYSEWVFDEDYDPEEDLF